MLFSRFFHGRLGSVNAEMTGVARPDSLFFHEFSKKPYANANAAVRGAAFVKRLYQLYTHLSHLVKVFQGGVY